jgi:hypothetical protein
MSGRYKVQPVQALTPSDWRAIAFLVSSDRRETNAAEAFARLAGNRAREVRARFDFWISGGQNDRYFHGWPGSSKYKECWVFKWKENRTDQRLYGFLANPRPRTNPGFQVCVLAWHSAKTARETDSTILERIIDLRSDRSVADALRTAYPEDEGSNQRWVN